MSEVLSNRALNRALLARQGLLEPWDCSPSEAIERLVGLQAQSTTAPYVGLWSRLARFTPAELSRLLLDRGVVRIALMRSTLQLVTARDCLALRPVLRADLLRVLPPALRSHPNSGKIANEAMHILEQQPRTFAELGRLLARNHPELAGDDLCRIARNLLALVQVTPRGVWGQSMAATHTTAEHWLDAAQAVSDEPDQLIMRYLSTFGPATAADFAAWSGMSRVGDHFRRLAPQLATYRNERGQVLFDVPEGVLPDPGTPIPVRILAEFDNVLLGHADRSRVFDAEHRRHFMSINGLISSTFLIDGFVAGTCRLSRESGTATATLQAFGSPPKQHRIALRMQAERLLVFSDPDAAKHQVRFAATR